jgi:hypothetical protein
MTAMSIQSSVLAARMAVRSLTASTSHTRNTCPSSALAGSSPCTVPLV